MIKVMKDCINNNDGFCREFDDYLNENFCETCDENCPFYERQSFRAVTLRNAYHKNYKIQIFRQISVIAEVEDKSTNRLELYCFGPSSKCLYIVDVGTADIPKYLDEDFDNSLIFDRLKLIGIDNLANLRAIDSERAEDIETILLANDEYRPNVSIVSLTVESKDK